MDPDEAGALYFSFTGIPARLEGRGPGSFRFVPSDLPGRPPRDKVFVVLRERSDYQGWVKVEERWEEERRFRLDEAAEELVLYDESVFDRVSAGGVVVVLEDTVRQRVLNPMELTELREQAVQVIENLPEFPFAGLDGDELRLLHRGRWVNLPPGKDLRDDSEGGGWGRSALVAVGLLDRERVRFDPAPPPSGWLQGEPQPVPSNPR
jgi:hypothetical protein